MTKGTNPTLETAHKTVGKVHVLIPAAGRGARFGTTENKIFAMLAGKPVIAYAISAFATLADTVTVIGRPDERERLASECDGLTFAWCAGGESRQESVQLGLASLLSDENDVVLVHDGARPFVSRPVIEKCIAAVREHGSALVALPITETVKLAGAGDSVSATHDREGLWAAQTPQGARFGLLNQAFDSASRAGFVATDESALIERLSDSPSPKLVMGTRENVKITTSADIEFARRWMESGSLRVPSMRVGIGYDIHRFAPNRRLVLGGVEIESDLGLLGHSDADVVLHAICDALLGAAGLPDIGCLFPNTDERYSGISSIALLEDVAARLGELGFRVINVDCCIIAERPKISVYAPQMRDAISSAIKTESNRISIKATTNEGIGALGAGEGIACHATAMIAAD